MIFSSRIFLFVYLPIVLLGYYLIPSKIRNLYLLLFSLGFYAWADPKLLMVLILAIALNYSGGLVFSYLKNKSEKLQDTSITLFVILNLILLGYFKYSNFFIGILGDVAGLNLPMQSLLLPLGISFFTFSGISYLLDLKSGKTSVERNIINFGLYISLFPKLLQGPIARFRDVVSQIKDRTHSLEKFSAGAYRFVVGLAKKVILADQIGLMVDHIFSIPPSNHAISVAWLGAFAYSLQIFFDFSGYTDMAIGLGKMFGFDLPENFNLPYISKSITEFWRRWHITLSAWFRDYVFLPLDFKRRRKKVLRQESNIFILFLLTGLWHGAGWTFVLWGLWHGLIVIIESIIYKPKSNFRPPTVAKWAFTMVVLMIGWVLFRSSTMEYALGYLGVMFGFSRDAASGLPLSYFLNFKIQILLGISVIACMPWKKILEKPLQRYSASPAAVIIQDAYFVVLLFISVASVITYSTDSFIYFKF